MPNDEKKITRAQAEARIELLTDRLAITLVLLKCRYGDDEWAPWFGEAMWEDADGMAEVLRSWPDYRAAREIVDLFMRRSERDEMGID